MLVAREHVVTSSLSAASPSCSQRTAHSACHTRALSTSSVETKPSASSALAAVLSAWSARAENGTAHARAPLIFGITGANSGGRTSPRGTATILQPAGGASAVGASAAARQSQRS